MDIKKDYYEVLEVNSLADQRAIAEAYDRLSRRYQPDEDAEPTDPGRMQELDEAFDVLDDPVRRQEYDRLRANPELAIAATLGAEAEGELAEEPVTAARTPSPPRNWPAFALFGISIVCIVAAIGVLASVILGGSSEKKVTLASGITYVELEEGSGEPPFPGDALTVHYTGSLEDGTEFDTSRDGAPFIFFLGVGDVIPGWDQGIASMKEGGRRKLTVPPELAYGEQGVTVSGNTIIPPNATLLFDVEVVQVETTGEEITTGSGLTYLDFVVGRDPQTFQAATPQPGNEVLVNFVGETEAGNRFIDTQVSEQPYTFILGSGSEPTGFDEGVSTMKVGGSRRLIVPPELGYGDLGVGDAPEGIPAGATLIYDVQLLGIR